MKTMILFFTFIFWSPLFAQEQIEEMDDQAVQEEEITEADAEDAVEDEVSQDERKPDRVEPQRQQDKIQVECVCPASAPQEEVVEEPVAPSLFPDNAVFNVTPAPAPQPIEEQAEEAKLPPGYLEKLPPGYSNDQYKRIDSY